ncbi:uncharacterized protein [Rutidosis leptorrhynchoides]|uniref:uncharacterized protein n=1 Tax=Rutidosis leptorrhynchoides TaxID=125765 RepID=UPI003A99D5F2
MGLQESKMMRLNLARLRSIWGNHNFDYAVSLSRGFSGGLISMWDPNAFVKSNIWCDPNFLIVKGLWVRENIVTFMINVYAPQPLSDKIVLWNKLANFMENHTGDYILFGDWNSVRREDERCGSEFLQQDADCFNNFIESSGLHEVPLGGMRYTWRNKPGNKLSKLDRFFISNNVLVGVDDIKGVVLPRGFSDHSPIFLFQDNFDYGPTDPNLNIVAKLRLLKVIIKDWIHTSRTSECLRLKEVTNLINDLDINIDSGNADEATVVTRNNLFKEKVDLSKLNALDMLQKSRIKWDVEGDENSKFFHCSLKIKRGQQQIQGLMIDGNWVAVAEFNEVRPHYILSNAEASFLEREFEDDEIKRAVWDCGCSKAPGPDGFSFRFIKHFWDILQHDICRDIRKFFANFSMPNGANSAFFSLIPKCFGDTWCRWIMGCLNSARTSVLVNGSPTREFSIERGLRQGDPLSPFLFLIVMEGLHLTFQRAMEINFIRGVSVGANRIHLSHFLYADDDIILSRWSRQDLKRILTILEIFYLVSGLRINVSKSQIFGVRVEEADLNMFAAITGCRAGSFPNMYLGIPIGTKNLVSNWGTLVDKFRAKLSGWKASLISSGGRLTLLKSVMGSLGIYLFSLFKCPETILKQLESFSARFFLGWL